MIFSNNKEIEDLKRQIESLESANNDLVERLEEISKTGSQTHIIKLFPENYDQFVLDGKTIIDHSRAVYKSNQLTFSEAVLFKAGVASASREFENMVSSHSKDISDLRKNLDDANSKNAEALSTLELYRKQSEDAIRSLRELQTFMNSEVARNKEILEDIRAKHQSEIDQKNNEIEKLSNTISSLKLRYVVDAQGNIDTPYGRIVGGGKKS